MIEQIATRTIYTAVDGEIREIFIQFRKPTQSENGDWICECIIEGSGIEIPSPEPGMGVDSVQAIIGALESAGVTMEKSGLVVALFREAFLGKATANPIKLGDFLPRKIRVNHGLSDSLERLEDMSSK